MKCQGNYYVNTSLVEVSGVFLLVKPENAHNNLKILDMSDEKAMAWWEEKLSVSKHIIWFSKGFERENYLDEYLNQCVQ